MANNNSSKITTIEPIITSLDKMGEKDLSLQILDAFHKRSINFKEYDELAKQHGVDKDPEAFSRSLGFRAGVEGVDPMSDAIRNFIPPEFAEGGSVDSLRTIYFGR